MEGVVWKNNAGASDASLPGRQVISQLPNAERREWTGRRMLAGMAVRLWQLLKSTQLSTWGLWR